MLGRIRRTLRDWWREGVVEYVRMLIVLAGLRRTHRRWWKPSDRTQGEPVAWPPGWNRMSDAVYACNRIKVTGSPDQAFQRLIRAEQWEQWYANSLDVIIRRPPTGRFTPGAVPNPVPVPVSERGGGAADTPVIEPGPPPVEVTNLPGAGPPSELRLNSEFTWTTFGIRLRSRVTHYVPNEMIGWTARAPGVHAYHRWFFKPDGPWQHDPEGGWQQTRTGTLVITEECQRGVLPWLTRRLMNRGLHAGHQLWVESLRKVLGP